MELQGVEPSALRSLLALATDPPPPLPPLCTTAALELLQAAGMLQFLGVRAQCEQLLLSRLQEDCLEILGAAELLGERLLAGKVLEYVLCNFLRLGKTAIEKQRATSGHDTVFSKCDWETLGRVVDNPRLNCSDEEGLVKVLDCWGRVTGREGEVEGLLARWRKVERRLPLLPCVLGQRRSGGELLRRGSEGGASCRRGNPVLLLLQPEGKLREGKGLEEGGHFEPTGFKAVARGAELVVSGGEMNLGHSQWCLGVWVHDSLTGAWREAGQLSSPRRHHAAVVQGSRLWVVGGYGKHRVVLDTVEWLDLDTGEIKQCAPLPFGARRPAAAWWRSRLVVVSECGVVAYSEEGDTWDVMLGASLPPGTAVDCALAEESGDLFLTSTCSTTLYRLSSSDESQLPPSPPVYRIEVEGKWSREAGNACRLGSKLYNFYSDEFGDERLVESYCLETRQFSVQLSQELPDLEFSAAPQYSYGCFPLLDYDL